MNRRQRGAVFGKAPKHYSNPRMKARAQRPQVGRFVKIKSTGHFDIWVRDQLRGKIGIIVDDHPYMWDIVAKFKGTDRQGGLFAMDRSQFEIVKICKRKETQKERWAREDKEWVDYLWDDLMQNTYAEFDRRAMDPYSLSK